MHLALLLTIIGLFAAEYGDARNQQAQTQQTNQVNTGESAAKNENGQPSSHPLNQGRNTQIFNYKSDGQQARAEYNSGIRIFGLTITSDWVMAFLTLALVLLTLAYVVVAIWQVRTVHATERAWILADIGKAKAPTSEYELMWITPLVKNHGRTPGRIRKTSITSRYIRNGEKLPEEPIYAEGKTWDFILPPSKVIRPLLAILPTGELQGVAKREGRAYVYGYINYLDIQGKSRRSAFGFAYYVPEIDGGRIGPVGFYVASEMPLAYNRCT